MIKINNDAFDLLEHPVYSPDNSHPSAETENLNLYSIHHQIILCYLFTYFV